jgi:pimeloyl-ACP methyl ester carboxylesterase
MPTCVTADGVTIAYDDLGSGPGIVFVHGITDQRGEWAEVVASLATDHRCLVVELRGHGESGDATDYSAVAMAQDVAAVVDAAGLAEPPWLIGHSLGAVVATVYAASAPTRGVVNVDQPLRFSDFADALAPLAPLLRGSADEFHAALGAVFEAMQGDRLPDPVGQRLAAHRAGARQAVVLGVWNLVLDGAPEDLDALAASIGASVTVPYLCLHGLALAPGYQDWLAGVLPQAVVEEWPEHGHYLHLVDTPRFVTRLRQFLA